MARFLRGRLRKAGATSGVALATALVGVLAPTATASTGPADGALAQAFAAGIKVPVSAVGTPRAGSVRTTQDAATGDRWAVAAFVPSAHAAAVDQVAFQDGASKALFVEPAESGWRWQGSAGQAACSGSVPASVISALALGSASCDAGSPRPSAALRASVAEPDTLSSSISSIALGQVGVATDPAETSFGTVDCDPFSTLVAAGSPSSDGCGTDSTHGVADQNEEWCADFAKWVWEQAGVTANLNTLNAGANSFYAWALADGESPAAGSGTPAAGDAVLFYPAGTITSATFADHVGLITSVNSNGTVDMANGDFLGSAGITVQYNTNLSLTSWAGSTWGSGEQWVLIAPPSAAQPAAPAATITAPATAAAGTAVPFTASATESGGTISQYAWTFGDGRNNNTTGASVSHVFTRAGLYTVTMSATSNLGTVTTKTWNVSVSAAGSNVSSDPNASVWYTTVPVMQYEFTETSAGALAVDSWDGAAWLQQTEPGTLASGSGLTSLTYADSAVADATIPHAFYRTGGGTLGETYFGETTSGTASWVSATLTGSPAATSAIAAIAQASTPSVFYFNTSSDLDVSTESGSTWSSSVISGPATSAPGSLATAANGSTEYVFYLDTAGNIIAASNSGGSWQNAAIPDSLGVKAGTSLAADSNNSGIDVFFIDTAGKLAVASLGSGGTWQTQEIAGTPASGSKLISTSTLTSAGAVTDEVFYLTSAGTAGVSYWTGSAWQSGTLPGTATAINAVSSNTVPGSGQQVFLTNGSTPSIATSSAPGATWTSSALPSTPAAYPGTVLLYAATSADKTTALAAASYAGLPASQVTTSFAAAWAATLSGDYLVITVGQAADNALLDDPCGWTNPSADDPGTTPFDYVVRPLNVTLTNLFLVGAAATTSKTPQRTDDLAYFAVHGALPSGASVPTLASPGYSCLGSAS